MALNTDWYITEKEVDPDFEGSLWQELGYEAALCPTCGNHLYGGICLNSCHLSKDSREKFSRLMGVLADGD